MAIGAGDKSRSHDRLKDLFFSRKGCDFRAIRNRDCI